MLRATFSLQTEPTTAFAESIATASSPPSPKTAHIRSRETEDQQPPRRAHCCLSADTCLADGPTDGANPGIVGV